MTRRTVRFDVNPLFRGPTLEERARSGSPYREIPVSDIDVDPDQPRRSFDSSALEELAASIKEYGLLSPVLVRVTGPGAFRLVAGERRLRASRLAGLETIPAIVDSEEDGSPNTLAKQLVENIQRQDLSPLDRASAIGQLRDQFDLSVRDLARKLGVSKALVQRSLEILALPDDLQSALSHGASESKILVIGELQSRDQRRLLLEKMDNLTREELQREVAAIRDGTAISESYHGGTRLPGETRTSVNALQRPEDQRIVEELQRALGTRVALTRKKGDPERGRLLVEFYSNEELTEIFGRLTRV